MSPQLYLPDGGVHSLAGAPVEVSRVQHDVERQQVFVEMLQPTVAVGQVGRERSGDTYQNPHQVRTK
jgi:hypothetical protein